MRRLYRGDGIHQRTLPTVAASGRQADALLRGQVLQGWPDPAQEAGLRRVDRLSLEISTQRADQQGVLHCTGNTDIEHTRLFKTATLLTLFAEEAMQCIAFFPPPTWDAQ